MKHLYITRLEIAAAGIIGMFALTTLSAGAISQTPAAGSTTGAAAQSKLQLIISVGNGEISRRLTTLGNLNNGINDAKKLTSSDRTTLTNEVNTESGSLTSLKTKLDAETTVTAATTDDVNVITEYRVYLLVVPKVYIVVTADDQQTTEGVLTSLAGSFQTAITAAQKAGKNVATLQSELSDLNGKLTASTSISSAMETGVVGLQPSDYNTNQTVLVGDYDKLQTAQTDNGAAISDANQILSGLQAL